MVSFVRLMMDSVHHIVQQIAFQAKQVIFGFALFDEEFVENVGSCFPGRVFFKLFSRVFFIGNDFKSVVKFVDAVITKYAIAEAVEGFYGQVVDPAKLSFKKEAFFIDLSF